MSEAKGEIDAKLEQLQVLKVIQCVRAQDAAQVSKLVEMGVSGLVDMQDEHAKETPLHVAVTLNYDSMVSRLLGLGASHSVRDRCGRTPVMRACEYGHVQALEALAMKPINAAVTDSDGKPALFHCLHPTNRHAKCLGFLLDCGADPNTVDEAGFPVLCAVCQGGYDKLLERLLDKGADPNAREPSEGKPAVAFAAEGGHIECLKLLMNVDADSSASYGPKKLCAIHRAASLGAFEVIQVLSAYGADFRVATTSGENAMHFATTANKLLCIRLLGQRGCPANEANEEGLTPQKIAKTEGFKDCMKELKKLTTFQDKIARGAKPKGFAELWCIKLYDWIQVNKRAVFDLLRSASVHSQQVLAAKAAEEEQGGGGGGGGEDEGKKKKKELTLEEGTMPSAVFCSTLREAGCPLKGAGAVPDVGSGSGYGGDEEDDEDDDGGGGRGGEGGEFAKLLAVYDKKRTGKVSYDDFLTEQKYIHAQYKLGPNDDIKGKKGKGKKGKKGGKGKKGKTKIPFPIYYEVERPPTAGVLDGVIRKEEFLTDIQRFGRGHQLPHTFIDDSPWYLAQPDQQYILLHEAIRKGDLQSLHTSLSCGMSVDARDKYNKTPLMVAASHGMVSMVHYLLDKGADVNAIDNFQWTSLHHACHSGEELIMKKLLEEGANIDAQSYNGGTPLMRAIETSQKDIVKLLLERGAKVGLENKNGNNALEVAKNWGDEMIYAILYAKASTLPPPVDKKGEKGKGKESKGKGKDKGKKGKKAKDDSLPKIIPGPPLSPPPPPAHLPTPSESMQLARKRCSLGSMQASTVVRPTPNYRPQPAWVSRPPSTKSFMETQGRAREERGLESIDFGETRTPFQLQILARVQALEVSDT